MFCARIRECFWLKIPDPRHTTGRRAERTLTIALQQWAAMSPPPLPHPHPCPSSPHTLHRNATGTALYQKFETHIPRNETVRPRSKFLHSHDRSSVLSWEYINRSQIHDSGNWETEHYNSVLEITRPRSLISGNILYKSELDIYIRFSPALHLKCSV
jgi:hypothetical protein